MTITYDDYDIFATTDEDVPCSTLSNMALKSKVAGLASYNCAKLCDVEFKFPNNTSLYSHSHILKEACGYFDALASFHAKADDGEGKKIVVQVKDITSDELVFRRFILYIHTGLTADLALTSETIVKYLHLHFYLDVKARLDFIAHACGKVKRSAGWLNEVKVAFDSPDTAVAEGGMTKCIRQVLAQPCLLLPPVPNNRIECNQCQANSSNNYNYNRTYNNYQQGANRCDTCIRCKEHCNFERIFPAAALTGVWLMSSVRKGMPLDIFKIRKDVKVQPGTYKLVIDEIRKKDFKDISAREKDEFLEAMHLLFSVA